jgi:hypothetical protein
MPAPKAAKVNQAMTITMTTSSQFIVLFLF